MNLSEPIRTALLAEPTIADELSVYGDSRAIFTRRPVPDDATYPMIVVSQDIAVGDEDGIADFRPVITRDVIAYGHNSTPAKFRQIEALGYAIQALFHRQRQVLTVPDWSVISIIASGPRAAPVDDLETAGRLVELAIRLARRP